MTPRVASVALLAALALAGCSAQDPAPTVTVTQTPAASATPSESTSSSGSTPTDGTPADGATATSGADAAGAAYLQDLLDDSPALDRIDRGDLVKIGLSACDTLSSGGSEDIAEQGLRDGSTQFSADEAEDVVDAARDHLCP